MNHKALNGMATSSSVPLPKHVFHLERPPLMLPSIASPFFIVSLSHTLPLCGNIHTSHVANVRTLSISLSVVLSVFHDLFTHFIPQRTSIFNSDGSMFSHGLIKDTVCMHNTCTHSVWIHMWVCCLQRCKSLCSPSSLPVVKTNQCQWSVRFEPAVSWQDNTGNVLSNCYKITNFNCHQMLFTHYKINCDAAA